MVEIKFNKPFIIFCLILTIGSYITVLIGEIQASILPKFISASYKDNLSLKFNSLCLRAHSYILLKLFKPSIVSYLVGDLPIIKNKTENEIKKVFRDNIEDLKLEDIDSSEHKKFYLFPNKNKTLIKVLYYGTNKINEEEIRNIENNISFPEFCKIDLLEIPLDNFIINYQNEFDLHKSFLKKKLSLKLKGTITKHSFSNDYSYFVGVYKNIINHNQIQYHILYLNLESYKYEEIDLPGSMKVNSISVTKNMIVYSRKFDAYEYNIMIREIDGNWITIPKNKVNLIKTPYFSSSGIRTFNDNKGNRSVFIRGIKLKKRGVKLFMKIYPINTSNNITNGITLMNKNLMPFLFEGKNYDIYDLNYTFNYNKIKINKLNERLKEINSKTVFNKIMQDESEKHLINFQYMSNIKTYNTLFMDFNKIKEDYFSSYNQKKNKNKTESFTTKDSEIKIKKLCGKENIVFQSGDNKLYYLVDKNINEEMNYKEIRRISFVSIPKNFKFNKILDFYFDNFNGKEILLLITDEMIIISLDFSDLRIYRNNSNTFFLDNFDFKKETMLIIGFMFFFLYYVDWSQIDQISRDIKDSVVHFLNYLYKSLIAGESLRNTNVLEHNNPPPLNLSNSNLSLNSSISNIDIDNNNNRNNNIRQRTNSNNGFPLSILDDIVRNADCDYG